MTTPTLKAPKAMFWKPNPTCILTSLLLAVALPHQLFAAGPAPVNLRSTANFVILSGAGITSTGDGIINGDVGASPISGSALGVACPQVNGTIYAVDAAGPACAVIDPTRLTTAKGDLTTAFNDAAGRTPIPSGPFLNPNGGNLGGLNLAPGLYKFTGTALITGADVTLTGGPEDVWIFQIGSDLQLGSGIKVILAGGAQARNVFWQVGTSAVLGTSSDFKGTILADQAITMNTSSTMEGRALAFSAGVTFNGAGAGAPTALAGPEIALELPDGTDLVDDVDNADFGPVYLGTETSQTFTIRNLGGADLSNLSVTIDGADAALFAVTTDPDDEVSSNGSTTFTVSFAPDSTGPKAAALTITNNDTNENPFFITLTGAGTTDPAPEIIVIEQQVGTELVDGVGSTDFGGVDLGNNTSLTFTIWNIGSADLTDLDISIDGADAALFTVTEDPFAPVSPNDSTTFTVQFAPISTGPKTAALHIASNDSSENFFDITLRGSGLDGGLALVTNVLATAAAPITLNPQTGLFEQLVRLTNSSSNSIEGLRLGFLNLPADVQVYNASGNVNGIPFVQYDLPLAAGATVDLLIEYYRANRQTIPQPLFLVWTDSQIPVPETGPVLAINSFTNDVSGQRFLLEFTAVPGRRYAVQYSSDANGWKTANPIITAPANRVQWYDDGPPKTESKPTDVASRFYQIMQLP